MSYPQRQPQLELFSQRLPVKPYCTDDLSSGLFVRSAMSAIEKRYVQHNGPTHKYWLAFDVDRPHATFEWQDLNCPAPHITIQNPENGHAHLLYGLSVSVRTAADGSSAALRFAAAVEHALALKLKADVAYSGLIVKNPLHQAWKVNAWQRELYDLHWLADSLDLSSYSDRRKNLPEYGLGRNHNLFERLRKWAYKAIRQGWPDYEQWLMACQDRATAYNDFASPLPAAEVMHTAKSVAKYTHRNFNAASFSQWQASQGAKGGKKSKGGGRPNLGSPWIDLGVSRATYFRWKKNGALK